MATATVVTILAGFLLFARPATYTATALVAGGEASAPALISADRLARLATALKDTPELRLRRAARPGAPTIEAELQTRFQVRPHTLPGWLALSFSHQEPAIAALAVNTAARLALRDRRPDADSELLQSLEAAERALQTFDSANPRIAGTETGATAPGATTTEAEQAADRTRLDAVDAEIRSVRDRLAGVAADDPTPVEERPGIVRVRRELERALLAEAALARRYGPRHQQMVAAGGEVDAARRLLAEQLTLAREQLGRELEGLLARREALVDEAAKRADRQRTLDALRSERASLRLGLDQARRRYESTGDTGNAISEAPIPLSPDLPRELPGLGALFLVAALASILVQARRA